MLSGLFSYHHLCIGYRWILNIIMSTAVLNADTNMTATVILLVKDKVHIEQLRLYTIILTYCLFFSTNEHPKKVEFQQTGVPK